MKWRPDEVVWKGGDKPKIGVMWDDGVVVPQAPMRKALKLAVEKLRAEGYEVFDYRPFKQSEGWDIIVGTAIIVPGREEADLPDVLILYRWGPDYPECHRSVRRAYVTSHKMDSGAEPTGPPCTRVVPGTSSFRAQLTTS